LLDRRGRTRAGAFLVEGPHAVAEAFASPPHEVRELFVTASAASRERSIVRDAQARDVAVTVVTPGVLASLGDTITPQGMVAVVTRPEPRLAAVLGASVRLVVVLHRVADPGNAGTVIRTADAAGADAVVFTAGSVDPHNGKCVRATAGSIFHLPVVVGLGAAAAALAAFRDAGLTVAATALAGADDLDAVVASGRLDGPVAWVFGNEAHGLPEDVLAAADMRVRIPIRGRAESLNLAAAAAVCLFATARAHAERTR
jgi:RNA methyltransferase, TrmH family